MKIYGKMISQTLIILSLLLFTSNIAIAKVTYNKSAANQEHIDIIKGFLYSTASTHPDKNWQEKWHEKYAKAAAWLDKVSKEKKIYDLFTLQNSNESANIVVSAVDIITKVANGHYQLTEINADELLNTWHNYGKRLIINKRRVPYKKGKKTFKKTVWYFKLNPKKAVKEPHSHNNPVKHLVYWHST